MWTELLPPLSAQVFSRASSSAHPQEHHPVSKLPGALRCYMWAEDGLWQTWFWGSWSEEGDSSRSWESTWRNLFQAGSRLTPFPVLMHCSSYRSREGRKAAEPAGCGSRRQCCVLGGGQRREMVKFRGNTGFLWKGLMQESHGFKIA